MEPPPLMPPAPSNLIVSVVIPTRNRRDSMRACLDALADQTLPTGSFEVVVVDDGSEPVLELESARWAKRFSLKVLHQLNTGPAAARNRGVAASQAEFIAFTDDDTLPRPDWLQRLVGALQDNPEALVGGSTFNGVGDDLFAETSAFVLDLAYAHFNRDVTRAVFFASNNMAIRRDGFLSIGGFDARFTTASEDREFCDRWRLRRRPLLWERDALVEHRHRQGFRGFCLLHFRYGMGAFFYQATRRARDSGKMREDLGFHRHLPGAVMGALKGRRWDVRIAIVWRLMLWELVNAAGFVTAWLRARSRAPCSSEVLP